MSILPKISSVDVFTINENQNNYTYINLNKDNNSWITFKDTDKSNKYILQDLIENKAYATMLLYLNENYILQVGITNDIFKNSNGSVKDYLNECDEMLHNNISIVEEAGIPLCDINGYKIFEGAGYILRGNGKKKIKESFTNINEDSELDLFPSYKNKVLELIKEKKNKWDIYDFIDGAVNAYSISKDEAKELKNLVDNKNININENREEPEISDKESLINDIVKFAIEEDTYEFFDDYNSEEELYNEVENGLSNKEYIKELINHLKNNIVDYDDLDREKLLSSIVRRLEDINESLTEEDGEDIKFKYKSRIDRKFHSIPKRTLIQTISEDREEARNSGNKEDFEEADDALLSCNRNEAFRYKGIIYDPVDYRLSKLKEDGEGTQCADIAPKIDQDINKKTTNKKKYYDILLSNISENDNMNIINKGFLKNSKGQYQRGNYVLVKEGETYLAIHKNKIKN